MRWIMAVYWLLKQTHMDLTLQAPVMSKEEIEWSQGTIKTWEPQTFPHWEVTQCDIDWYMTLQQMAQKFHLLN